MLAVSRPRTLHPQGLRTAGPQAQLPQAPGSWAAGRMVTQPVDNYWAWLRSRAGSSGQGILYNHTALLTRVSTTAQPAICFSRSVVRCPCLSSARAATNIVACSQVCKDLNNHLPRHKKAPNFLGTLARWHNWACASGRGHDGGPSQKPTFLSPSHWAHTESSPPPPPPVSACF